MCQDGLIEALLIYMRVHDQGGWFFDASNPSLVLFQVLLVH